MPFLTLRRNFIEKVREFGLMPFSLDKRVLLSLKLLGMGYVMHSQASKMGIVLAGMILERNS